MCARIHPRSEHPFHYIHPLSFKTVGRNGISASKDSSWRIPLLCHSNATLLSWFALDRWSPSRWILPFLCESIDHFVSRSFDATGSWCSAISQCVVACLCSPLRNWVDRCLFHVIALSFRPNGIGASAAMNYDELTRRELQALCKEHGLPANKTNAVMADSLASLLSVACPSYFILSIA